MPLSRLRMVGPTRTLAATVWLFSVLAASAARADCAGGDGVISSPGVCATPQNLTGVTGTIASGATLSTGPAGAAYTVSGINSTVTNAGTVTSLGPEAFLINGPLASSTRLTNTGSITASQGPAIVVTGNPRNSLSLVNSGNIVGGAGTAVNYAPVADGTITQSAGTIDGMILLSGLQTVLNVTGGAINGSIRDQTPAAALPGRATIGVVL